MFKTLCIWAENAHSWPFVKPCFGVLPGFWAILRLYRSKMAKRLVHETDIHSRSNFRKLHKNSVFCAIWPVFGDSEGFPGRPDSKLFLSILGFWGLFPPILGQNRCFEAVLRPLLFTKLTFTPAKPSVSLAKMATIVQ